MSLIKTNAAQIGQSLTATNNFTLYQPASPDGTVRLGVGNAGSVTDIVTLNSSGNVGIGTSSPSAKLNVVASTVGDTPLFERTTSITNSVASSHRLLATSSGDMTDGFGPVLSFNIQDTANVINTIGLIGGVRSGADNSGALIFSTYSSGSSGERMRLDSSGNLGLGVTPSASWASASTSSFSFGLLGSLAARKPGQGVYLSSNVAFNGDPSGTAANGVYLYSDTAAAYAQYGNTHKWFTAPSGTAGNAISFTQAMTLDASSNLTITGGETVTGSQSGFGGGEVRLGSSSNDLQSAVSTFGGGSPTLYFDHRGSSSGAWIWRTGANERMRIDSSGNVGIGTSSPLDKLNVSASSSGGVGGVISVANGAAAAVGNESVVGFRSASVFGTTYYSGKIRSIVKNSSTYLSDLAFNVYDASGPDGKEAMRIDSSGNLLVGCTDNTRAGSVGVRIGAASTAGNISSTKAASTNADDTFQVYSTGASAYRFYVRMDGVIAATNTTITAISDKRYKENIRDLDVGLDAVMALKPRKFDWKEGKGKDIKDDRGFIAQEFEQVFPDLIDEWKDPAPEGEEPYKSVRQDLIPVLVKAIQELKAELDATKAEVVALKAK